MTNSNNRLIGIHTSELYNWLVHFRKDLKNMYDSFDNLVANHNGWNREEKKQIELLGHAINAQKSQIEIFQNEVDRRKTA